MPGTKEIRTKIASVKNTQKITKALEMVAASKMPRAQARMRASRPYSEKMRIAIGHLNEANPDYSHPFLHERAPKAVGLIVISTDRGLAGGLNTNLFKRVLVTIREWQGNGAQVSLCLIGSKAGSFFRRLGLPVLSQIGHLGDRPRIKDLIGTVKVMLDAYRDGKIDRLFLINNRFINTVSQKPEVKQLLPVETLDPGQRAEHWDYIYEPDARDVLEGLLMRYIESQVYQAAVENVACEMAARMVAMKSATDNAASIIEDLQLVYNKARQASITKELSEIVGGAAAV